MTTWTEFWDMHSGGGQKENFANCFIEAPEEEAKVIFYNRFGHNPERVTCACCGDDYSITEYNDLHQATAFQRGCAYSEKKKMWIENKYSHKKYIKLKDYIKRSDVLVIYAKDIKDTERVGKVPKQGFVWVE